MSEQGGRSILHAVVHYPHLESEGLNRFRQKYDPFAELIQEHLTLVFPIPVELQTIRAHVQATATEIQPFDLQIAGLKRTWDHWLYLGIEEGYEQIVALHDQLYSGPLREHLRTDLPFEPHIGIGFFGKGAYYPLDPESVKLDSEALERARIEAAELSIEARRRVETLTIVRLDTAQSTLTDVGTIGLGS